MCTRGALLQLVGAEDDCCSVPQRGYEQSRLLRRRCYVLLLSLQIAKLAAVARDCQPR